MTKYYVREARGVAVAHRQLPRIKFAKRTVFSFIRVTRNRLQLEGLHLATIPEEGEEFNYSRPHSPGPVPFPEITEEARRVQPLIPKLRPGVDRVHIF